MAIKKCKECGSNVSSSAKKCPNCGKKLKHTGLIVTACIIVFIIIVAVGGGSGVENTSQTSGTTTEKFTLQEGSNGYYDGYTSYYIEGTIKNNTNKQYSYVQVTFNLYDASGNQVGTAMDNVNNLEPNGTWKFKAIDLSGYGEKVVSYKLMEVTGW